MEKSESDDITCDNCGKLVWHSSHVYKSSIGGYYKPIMACDECKKTINEENKEYEEETIKKNATNTKKIYSGNGHRTLMALMCQIM